MKMDMSKIEKPEMIEEESEEIDLFADDADMKESDAEVSVSLADATDDEFEAEAAKRGYELSEEPEVDEEVDMEEDAEELPI